MNEKQLSAVSAEYQRCMDMLGDVPGPTLEDRLTRYIGCYMALQIKAGAQPQASADSASLRDALDNSQSLLVMIDHVGPDSASWIKEDIRDLLTKQIVENRTSLSDPKRAQPQSSADSAKANWARLSASEHACYRWPADTTEHRAMRAAFMDGAAHAVCTEPQTAPKLEALESCKGEQLKFEEWAAAEKYNMHEHPLHYLFMDDKTNAARQGWKAALRYAATVIAGAQCQAESVKPSHGIYIASKTKHAHRWLEMRAAGVPIISTWIDEAGEGESADLHDLWDRCISESKTCHTLIVYREPDDILKGAWVEIGAALGAGVPVYAAGLDGFTISKYRGIKHFQSIEDAFDAALTRPHRQEP